MKRVMTAVLAVLLLATISIGGVLPVYAETAHVHTAYEEMGLGASLPDDIGPDPSGYDESMSMPPLNAKPISTYADFQNMEPGRSYYLANDLTVYATYQATFTGNLYGNGHTITTNVPIFAKLDRAIVTDLVIKGEVVCNGAAGALAIDAIAPELYRVINYANVVATAADSGAGGLISKIIKSDFNIVFAYCENHGDVVGTNEAGGFVGYLQGTYDEADDASKSSHMEITHCLNTGNITAGKEGGGLVGQPGGGNSSYEWLYTLTMTNCANTGAITSTGGSVGGLIGESHSGHVTIDSCYNTGAVKVTSGNYDASGIIARIVHRGFDSTATVTNCYNTGDIYATGDVSGIVGEAAVGTKAQTGSTFKVENCYNSGFISGNRTGGIFGTANEFGIITKVYIKNCTNDGRVHSLTNYGGGISARVDMRAVDSVVEGFYDASVVYESCVNNGEVEVLQSQTGGMVGYSAFETSGGVHGAYNMEFYLCVNNGYIHTTDPNKDAKVGGLLGYTSSNARFYACVNTGELVGGGITGGLAAYVDRAVAAVYCASTGDMTGGLHIGGIVGRTRDSVITGDDETVSYDDHVFYGNLVTGAMTDNNSRAATHAKAMGGLAGYLWGDAAAMNNAVLSHIKGVYSSTEETGYTVSALFGGQGGDAAFEVCNNYFAGTLDAGTLGKKVLVTNAPDSTQLGTSSDASTGNYTNAAGLPLYYNGVFPSATSFTQTTEAVDSEAFLATLNSAAGEHPVFAELGISDVPAFAMTVSCEGDVYIADTLTAMLTFELTRTHSHPTYNYYTEQMSDETHHWMACAVCGAADPFSVEEHVASEGQEATCKTELHCVECDTDFGGVDPDNHEGKVTWECTATTHTATTECCGVLPAEEHTFENGVCTECGYECECLALEGEISCTEATCLLCGNVYDGTVTHVWSETEWVAVDDEDKHYRPCENCDAYDLDSGVACSDVKYPADCLNGAVCKDCEQTFGDTDPDNHAHPGSFYYDPEEDKCAKRYTCCDVVAELLDHVEETPADCQHRAVCANCGWSYGDEDLTNHIGDKVTYRVNETDSTKHDIVYECCGHIETEAHSGGTADCVSAAKCQHCGEYYGEANTEHAFDHKCDTICNVCGLLRSTEGHAFGGWLVTADPTESTAGSQMRACVICGAVQTATIAPITNIDSAILDMPEAEEQSDAYIGVIVIAAAAALVVGVIVAFIVHKKKKAK